MDSLMGNTRDSDLAEQKKSKGQNFKKDTVCKHFLLGFCPLNELAASKMLGKRNVQDCRKMHSEALITEFEEHPEYKTFKAEYEKSLLPVLEGLVREADAFAAREKANCLRTKLETPEKQTVNEMTPTIKEEYLGLQKDMDKLMAAAELEAEKGNVDGSKFKVMLAGEIKEKIQELEEKHIVTYTITHKGEEVCEICGARTEASTGTNHARYGAHFKGKVHTSYVKIREWIAKIKENIGHGDGVVSKKAGGSQGGGDRDRRDDRRDDRRRSRSRRGDRGGGDRGGRDDKRDDRRGDRGGDRRDDRRDDRDRRR